MSEFRQYQRKGLSEMREYIKGEDLTNISVADVDNPETDMGMVARNPKDHDDQWYVARKYFKENLQAVQGKRTMALEPGRTSTEWLLLKALTIGCIILAVLASLGKVPWTPAEAGAYMTGVATETTDYIAVFAPYLSMLAGLYMFLRSWLKKKEIENETTLKEG